MKLYSGFRLNDVPTFVVNMSVSGVEATLEDYKAALPEEVRREIAAQTLREFADKYKGEVSGYAMAKYRGAKMKHFEADLDNLWVYEDETPKLLSPKATLEIINQLQRRVEELEEELLCK